jgi:predicted O-methyltransferase YrrM
MYNPVIPITPPYTPEFLRVAQLAIEGYLANGGDVFEFGSGHSTVWFAQFANVVSVEHDKEWYNEVVAALADASLEAKIHLVKEENIPNVINDYELFDLVLVDCWDFQRADAAMKAIEHVKPGGWLVMDDSNWPLWKPVKEALLTWPYTEMRGPHIRKNGQRRSHETRIYERPFNA